MGRAAATDAAQLIATGRRVIGIEAAALAELAETLPDGVRRGGGADAGGARAGDRLGHGQVGAHGAQGRGDAGLDRHAGALRAPGRGKPRRSRDDHRRGRGAAAVELGRDARARRSHRLYPAVRDPADRGGGEGGLHAAARVGHRAGAAAGARGVLRRAGADHLDDDDAGARRRAGGGADGASRVHAGGLRRAASGRPARGAAGEGGRPDARGRRDAADRRRRRRWPRR